MTADQIVQSFFFPAYEVTTHSEVQDFLPEVNLKNKEELGMLIPLMLEDPESYQVKYPEYLQKAKQVLEKEEKDKIKK